MLPNFLIIGALKAGTTSIYSYLKQHPDVFMPSLKELRYFAFDNSSLQHTKDIPRAWPVTTFEAYLECFRDVGTQRAIGEASPNYLHSSIAAKRIKEVLLEPRLIVSLRNPGERLYSSYLMRYRAGEENRKFIDYFYDNSSDDKWKEWNSYYENLRRYFRIFSKDQIRIVLFEDLKLDATAVVKQLYEYIGVDSEFLPDTTVEWNKGGLPRNRHVHLFLTFCKKRLKCFDEYFPETLRRLVRSIKEANLYQDKSEYYDIADELNRFYMEDIQKTEELTGIELTVRYK